VLVVDRGRRDERADHRRDLRRPHPGRVDDELGGDTTRVGQDGRDLATGRQLEAGDPNPGPDADAERPGRIGDGVRRPMRVQVAVAGEVDRAIQRVRRDGGHQPPGLVGADDLGVQPDPARPARGPLELVQLVGARRESEAADRLERAERAVQVDAVAAEGHHRRRRVERRDEPGGLAGRAGRQLRLLDQQHVRPSVEREVVRHADAGDATADDDDASLVVGHQ
jgi:hypothetical protein